MRMAETFRMILGDGSATSATVSPNGQQVAFMSNRDGNWEVYRMGIDGSGLVRLTDDGANDGLPAWSPGGDLLAFASDRGGQWAIWATPALAPERSAGASVNPDGGGETKLFALPGPIEGYVSGEPAYSARGWVEERISWGP